jgi:peptidoglycan hydrolase CwlO-like protein
MTLYATLKLAVSDIKMKKNPKKMASLILYLKTPAVLALISCLILGAVVHAQSDQQQINSLNAQNAQSQQSLNSLQLQASSYQDAISTLQTQISAIQGAINANEAQEQQLEQKITYDQTQINMQKQLLGQDIASMYVNDQLTTVEMLATSKNLSDFVDAETYRGAVQSKLQNLLTQIALLQNQLEGQKTQLDQTLATQQAQQTQLSSDQSQQDQLLSMNQGQQATYDAQIAANNGEIAQLKAAQARANESIASSVDITASGGSGGACDVGQGNGGYPSALCNASQDSLTDAFGFPNRECTSFANWYFVTQEGQTSFRVSGNAGWWWETSNYPVTTYSPGAVKVGAIGVEPSSSLNAPIPTLHTSIDGGYYGHVMIVKALPGTSYQGVSVPSGDVLVASMNEDGAGHFMYNLWPDAYLLYINPQ